MPAEGEILDRGPGDHIVLFYRDDDELAATVSGHLLQILRGNGAVIVLATPAHQLSFEERLEQAGVDIAAAQVSGRYLALDAAETMRQFMTPSAASAAGWPDPASFWLAISPLVRQAVKTGRPVHVFGEMVALLWDTGMVNAAIEVEAMWNEMGSQYSFSLLCAYPENSVSEGHYRDAVAEVCRLHTAAIGLQQ